MRSLHLALALLLLPVLAHAQDSVIGEFQAGGQTFVLILRPKQVTPPPPPPPPPPIRRHVYGVQLPDGTWTREVSGGDVIRLRGEGLGTELGTVEVAGISAELIGWSEEMIAVRVGMPHQTQSAIGPVVVRSGIPPLVWEARSPFDVSVSPRKDIPPPPPPLAAGPVIHGYTGALGEPVTIDGKDFGDTPGTVLQVGTPVEVVLWSDTRIVVTSRGSKVGATFAVIRADGTGYYVGQMR